MALRVVFMGTPDYAAVSLLALLEAGYDVVGVFTQPDRPQGRGKRLAPSPAKRLAMEWGIPVHQPKSIRRDGLSALSGFRPDLCVTAAFGQILSEEVLSIPRLGTVNVHASLLPKYRGSSPVQWCLINGETRTGVTTMMTDRGIDTGDILLQEELQIQPDETAGALTARLAALGAGLLLKTLPLMASGSCPRKKQDEAEATYYPMLQKEMGLIPWETDATRVVNLVRGLNPWPLAFVRFPEGPVKILAAKEAELSPEGQWAGMPLVADGKQGLIIAAGRGAVRILRLKAAGGREMSAEDYLRGHPLPPGWRFGPDTSAPAPG